MKYKEVKNHFKSGKLKDHYFVDENGNACGELRRYYENGQLNWHNLGDAYVVYGEAKAFNSDGSLRHHYLEDSESNELASVIEHHKTSTHTEEQLIQIAKEHNLPLLSELPKTEAEVTHWNLKWPDCPCLPIESK